MSWSPQNIHEVEGMGAMRWNARRGRGERAREGCMEGWGGESGQGRAGGHGLGPFQVHGAMGPWEGCMEGEGVWVVAAMRDMGP